MAIQDVGYYMPDKVISWKTEVKEAKKGTFSIMDQKGCILKSRESRLMTK